MTLLIAVADSDADARTGGIGARACQGRGALGRGTVHVRETGPGWIRRPATSPGLELTAIGGDPVEALPAGRRGRRWTRFAMAACGSDQRRAAWATCAEALLSGRVGAGAAGAARHATGSPASGASTCRWRAAPRALRRDAPADDALLHAGREIVILHVVPAATRPPRPAACRRRAWWTRSTTSGRAWQKTSSRCASRRVPEGGRHRVAVRVGEPAGIIPRRPASTAPSCVVAVVERKPRERPRRRDQVGCWPRRRARCSSCPASAP